MINEDTIPREQLAVAVDLMRECNRILNEVADDAESGIYGGEDDVPLVLLIERVQKYLDDYDARAARRNRNKETS